MTQQIPTADAQRKSEQFEEAAARVDVFTSADAEGSGEQQLVTTAPLTRRVLAQMEVNSLEPCPEVRVVPSSVFTGSDRFGADVALMRRTPHVVAWGGEIPRPGDYTTKDVAGVPVLLVRGQDGAPRAFLNACVHRGAQLATDCGHTRRFTCPYHAWSYDTEGRLVGIPGKAMFDGLDLDGRGLRSLPVSEQVGLIVVGLDESVCVDGYLNALELELSDYRFDRYSLGQTDRIEVKANWKLVVDVNFEGYHFPYVHRETLAPICTNNSVFDIFDQHCRWAFPFRNIEELRDKPEDHWPSRFNGTVVYGIFPSCVLVETPMSTQMLRIYPGESPGESVAYVSGGAFEEILGEEAQAMSEFALEGALKVLRDEDFPAAESCQAGLRHSNQDVLIGRCEPLVQHFHDAWDRHLDPVGSDVH